MNGDGEANGVDDGQEKTLTINGKKVDKEPDEEELSEEDKNLKSELEMLITRLKEPDMSLYLPALITMKDFIKTSTSSMTAVPKPWKFLMPHYKDLTTTFESWPSGEAKDAVADVLSVLRMTLWPGHIGAGGLGNGGRY